MKAPCPHFSKCSGCTLQQFPYVKQVHDKSKEVFLAFQVFVPKEVDAAKIIHPVVPSPLEFQYRISTKLCLHEDDQGQRSIGLYQRGSKKVIDIPNCPAHHPAINRLLKKIFAPARSLPAPFYQHHRRAFQIARLKFVTIRHSPETGAFGVILSHTGVPLNDLKSWVDGLRLAEVSVYASELTKEDEDLVVSRNVQHLAGPPSFPFQLVGHTFDLDPMAFYQANHSLTESFIHHIVDGLGGQVLLDLYGGFGSYSFAAKNRFQSIYVVEANARSIEAAERTATHVQRTDIKACPEKVEDFLKRFGRSSQAKSVTDVIVNPPRAGLSPIVIRALLSPQFPNLQRLHYVSCNPETLKRDMRQLLSGPQAYRLSSLTPFDMFPQTDHIECVAKLLKSPQASFLDSPSSRNRVARQHKPKQSEKKSSYRSANKNSK